MNFKEIKVEIKEIYKIQTGNSCLNFKEIKVEIKKWRKRKTLKSAKKLSVFTLYLMSKIPKKKRIVKRKTLIEKNEAKGYTSILNRVIRNSKLSDKEYRVLMILISHYNQKEGISYPSNERIEKEVPVCEKTRKEIINSLIKKRLLRRIFRNGTTNAFTFPCGPFPKNTNKSPKEKKGKPYYHGQEMRYSGRKWWVISKYGEWLEFADSKDKIEWK